MSALPGENASAKRRQARKPRPLPLLPTALRARVKARARR